MKRAVVVGAGIAGLTAAYRLQQAGLEVKVFEKENYVGGRMRSEKIAGIILDYGAQFFYDEYKSTFALCRELGLAAELHRFDEPYGVFRGGRIHVLEPPRRNPWSGLCFGAISFSSKLKLAKAVLTILRHRRRFDLHHPEDRIIFDTESVADYCRRELNEEILEYLAQPLVCGLTLGEPEEMSKATFLSTLQHQMMCRLYTLRGGIGSLPEAVAGKLAVHLQTEVLRLEVQGGAFRSLTLRDAAGQSQVEADLAILAVPAPLVPRLVPDLKPEVKTFFESTKYSRCAATAFGLEKRITGSIYAVTTPRQEGTCFTAFSENAIKCPSYAPPGGGSITAFPAGKKGDALFDQPDEAVSAAVWSDLRRVVPAAPEQPAFARVQRFPQALVLFRTGFLQAAEQFKQMDPGIDGLHFAGDYLMTAAVEGSVESGIQAAARALRGQRRIRGN